MMSERWPRLLMIGGVERSRFGGFGTRGCALIQIPLSRISRALIRPAVIEPAWPAAGSRRFRARRIPELSTEWLALAERRPWWRSDLTGARGYKRRCTSGRAARLARSNPA